MRGLRCPYGAGHEHRMPHMRIERRVLVGRLRWRDGGRAGFLMPRVRARVGRPTRADEPPPLGDGRILIARLRRLDPSRTLRVHCGTLPQPTAYPSGRARDPGLRTLLPPVSGSDWPSDAGRCRDRQLHRRRGISRDRNCSDRHHLRLSGGLARLPVRAFHAAVIKPLALASVRVVGSVRQGPLSGWCRPCRS